MRTILVTDGVDPAGLATVREVIQHTVNRVVVVDKLTYAGNLMSPVPVAQDTRFAFGQVDICDRSGLDRTFRQHRPDTVMYLATESYVDCSIDDPAVFIGTNTLGTYTLLEVACSWWSTLATERESAFCFHHILTDGVYGNLHGSGDFLTETAPCAPSNPHSVSRVNNDRLVRAWLRTHGLPTLIINYSNNYGPYHFPEKLIPLTTPDALAGRPFPVYGNEQQIRDWLYTENHARALYLVAIRGEPGGTYNIGNHNEYKSIEVAETTCQLLEELAPYKPQSVVHCHNLTTFVADCPNHDPRYVINALKIARKLGCTPAETSTSGIRKTVAWYLANESWWRQVRDGSHQSKRLGLQD